MSQTSEKRNQLENSGAPLIQDFKVFFSFFWLMSSTCARPRNRLHYLKCSSFSAEQLCSEMQQHCNLKLSDRSTRGLSTGFSSSQEFNINRQEKDDPARDSDSLQQQRWQDRHRSSCRCSVWALTEELCNCLCSGCTRQAKVFFRVSQDWTCSVSQCWLAWCWDCNQSHVGFADLEMHDTHI